MSNEITMAAGNENIGRLLVHYAIPPLSGPWLIALYNIVDVYLSDKEWVR